VVSSLWLVPFIAPAKSWRPVPAVGWQMAYPVQANLLGSISAEIWWRSMGRECLGSPPGFSQNRPKQVGLFWGKLHASLWLALFTNLWLVQYKAPAKGYGTVPAVGWQAAYPSTIQLVGVYFGWNMVVVHGRGMFGFATMF